MTPRVPRTAMAFRCLEPITAPTPERPKARSMSLTMQANLTPTSPARPMLAIFACGSCNSRRNQGSVSHTDRPHSSSAGLISTCVVTYPQVNRLLGAALDDQQVVSRHLQLGAEHAAGIRRRDGAGQRALGDRRRASTGGRGGRGQRPGGDDQLVLGRQRVDPGVDFLDQVLAAEATLAEISLRPVPVQRFAAADSRKSG